MDTQQIMAATSLSQVPGQRAALGGSLSMGAISGKPSASMLLEQLPVDPLSCLVPKDTTSACFLCGSMTWSRLLLGTE